MSAEMEPLTALQSYEEFNKMYPGIWRLFDEVRSEAFARKMQGKISNAHWPDWCYAPLDVAALTLRSILKKTWRNNAEMDYRALYDARLLTAFSAWRMTKGIYRFDSDIYSAILETPIDGDIPHELLLRLPEFCIYVETPGIKIGSIALSGFFVHLEPVRSGQFELRLLLNENLFRDHLEFAIIPIDLELASGRNLTETITSILRDGRELLKVVNRAAAEGLAVSDPEYLVGENEHVEAIRKIVNLLLFICTQNSEISGKHGNPGMPEAVKLKGGRTKVFAAPSVRQWDVGVRMGAALRAAQDAADRANACGSGSTVRPHIRRAHWHLFLSGPRMRDGQSVPREERQMNLRWMPPIAVNVDDVDELPATIRPVK